MSGTSEAQRFDAVVRQAETVFPGVSLDRATFVAFASAHPARDEAFARDDDDGLLELFLVAALRARLSAAEHAFEQRYLAPLASTLGRMGLSPSELDEVKQRVRAKLLVRDGQGPMSVEEYAGRGRLSGLLAVVATREALDGLRKNKREVPITDDALADPAAAPWDPGLEMLKGRARDAFRAAFEAAVRSLEPRERNLLRLHLLGGVTLEQLAKVYGVHRATVVRWLAAARENVLSTTRREVGHALDLRGDELESVMNAARSRLDLSVERMLRSAPGLAEPGEPGVVDRREE